MMVITSRSFSQTLKTGRNDIETFRSMSMITDDEAKNQTGQMSTSKTIKKFMQQVFNKICTEHELSAVEVCTYLLGHTFDYSSVSSNE